MAIARGPVVDLAVATEQPRMVCIAKARGRFDESVQYHLQIESRAADDLEHIGGRGLLLQGFTQFVEQPGVLDGDDGLVCKGGRQVNLFVGERLQGFALKADSTNRRSFPE